MVKTKASLILATSQNKIYTVERKTLTWQLALYVKRREKLEKKLQIKFYHLFHFLLAEPIARLEMYQFCSKQWLNTLTPVI